MFKIGTSNFRQRLEKTEYQLIQLISVKRSYKERRDKKRFRELVEISEEITLSRMQVSASTSHAQETLVVAGAGSGKTFVLVGRAKYLVKSKRVPEEKILMLAFNKDAARELDERTKASDINVQAKTFHSFGNSILRTLGHNSGVAFGVEGQLTKFIASILEDGLDGEAKKDLALYFAFQNIPRRDFDSFKTKEDYVRYKKSNIFRTLNDEIVKSYGEWLIANYLFANSIEYIYEPIYRFNDSKQSHRPDFVVRAVDKNIWIEYFGFDREMNVAPDVDKDKYLFSYETKIQEHKNRNTELIDLYYYDLKEGTLISKLETALKKYEIPIKPKSNAEILAAANDIGYYTRFERLIEQFLVLSRSQLLSTSDLESLAQEDERNIAFLRIFNHVYTAYLDYLNKTKLSDFADQIHGAAEKIESGEYDFPFTHVLVDEFQDISPDRFRLLNAMRIANPSLEMTYVGDDWQSIYRFGGSDIEIMREVSKPKMYRKRIDLDSTYRLPQTIADISSHFILKNPMQLSKKIVSKNELDVIGDVIIHWDKDSEDVAVNVGEVIMSIGQDAENPNLSLRILARYRSNLPSLKDVEMYWEGPIYIDTIHSAKGLESDYVIVVDLRQDFKGFPSTIEDDPVMQMIRPKVSEYEYAEERRLFYVAITRALRQTHLITSPSEPSVFATELLEDRQGTHIGYLVDTEIECPACNKGTIIYENGDYRCSDSARCIFHAPYCFLCKKQMMYVTKGYNRYQCSSHKKVQYRSCPKCSWGALVPRTNRSSGQRFSSCFTWELTQCKGKSRYF